MAKFPNQIKMILIIEPGSGTTTLSRRGTEFHYEGNRPQRDLLRKRCCNLEGPSRLLQQCNEPRIFQLKKELVNCTQGATVIGAYYTKFKSVWEQFGEFCPLHNYNCDNVQSLLDHMQSNSVLTFLMRLNDSFVNVRGQIFLMDHFPSIDCVFALVSQDEKQRKIVAPLVLTKSPMACVVTAPQAKHNRCERPTCSHCGVISHFQEKCFKLHGYPPSYNNNAQMLRFLPL